VFALFDVLDQGHRDIIKDVAQAASKLGVQWSGERTRKHLHAFRQEQTLPLVCLLQFQSLTALSSLARTEICSQLMHRLEHAKTGGAGGAVMLNR
jgi:hypothetical protein